jgi:hypothetical protein
MFYMKFAGSLNLAWKLNLAYLTYYVAKTRLIEPGNLTYCIQLLKLPRPLINGILYIAVRGFLTMVIDLSNVSARLYGFISNISSQLNLKIHLWSCRQVVYSPLTPKVVTLYNVLNNSLEVFVDVDNSNEEMIALSLMHWLSAHYGYPRLIPRDPMNFLEVYVCTSLNTLTISYWIYSRLIEFGFDINSILEIELKSIIEELRKDNPYQECISEIKNFEILFNTLSYLLINKYFKNTLKISIAEKLEELGRIINQKYTKNLKEAEEIFQDIVKYDLNNPDDIEKLLYELFKKIASKLNLKIVDR